MTFWIPKTFVKFHDIEPSQGKVNEIKYIECFEDSYFFTVYYDIPIELCKRFEIREKGCVIPEGFYRCEILDASWENDGGLRSIRIRILEPCDPSHEITVIRDYRLVQVRDGCYSARHRIAFLKGKVITSTLSVDFIDRILKEMKSK